MKDKFTAKAGAAIPAILLLGLATLTMPEGGPGLIETAWAAGDSHTGGTTHTGPSSHTGGSHSGGRYGRPSHAGSGHESGEHETGEHESGEHEPGGHESAKGEHEKGKKGKAAKGRGHGAGIAMGSDGGPDIEAGIFRFGGRSGAAGKDRGGDRHDGEEGHTAKP